MRVAWFTPIGHKSAIAEYSTWVAPALAGLCELDVWVPGVADARALDVPIVDFANAPDQLDRLSGYDLIAYNLGNHERLHAAIYDVSVRHPGLVVLHDRTLHHFFFTHWNASGRRDVYVERMGLLYGPAARRAAAESFMGARDPVWEDDEAVRRYPLVEEAFAYARGVVVHASDHAEEVRERWFGPAAALFLPAYQPAGSPDVALPAELRPDPRRTTLVTVGQVNRNKQVHRVIEALAGSQLRERVRYVVVGPRATGSAYDADLEALVQHHELDDTVYLAGYRSDDVVRTVLEEADILVNLRFPSFESGSASLMQGLALGKPTVVYDAGGFADLPEDVVVKVAPLDGHALESALERLVGSHELRRETGSRARAFAEKHSPDRYARELLAFAEEVRAWGPVLGLCDRVADELGRLAVSPSLGVVDRVAHDTSLLFAGQAPGVADAVVLRPVDEADERALARFFARNDVPEVVGNFDPFPFDEGTAERIARTPTKDQYYGAFLGQRLVALSMLRGWEEGYDVPSFGIAVDADLHGAGIGRRMTEWTIDQARSLGSARVRLSVYGRNTVARAIYDRLGFAEVERSPVRRNGVEDDRIVMLKDLD